MTGPEAPGADAADLERSGKWLIYTQPEETDRRWMQIRKATEAGDLGVAAKAATAKQNPLATSRAKLICVYTRDYEDREDVREVLRALRQDHGIHWRLAYKTDEATLTGVYGQGSAIYVSQPGSLDFEDRRKPPQQTPVLIPARDRVSAKAAGSRGWVRVVGGAGARLSVPGLTITVTGRKRRTGNLESSVGDGAGLGQGHAGNEAIVMAPESLATGMTSGLSVYESSFPARVAAFLRFSPVIEAAQSARRRDWPDGSYDIVTLALTAIDLVVSRQGFELEAERADVVSALTELACMAAPERPADEHRDVAAFVVDSLLNRQGHQAPFRYVTSDYSSPEGGHRQREVPFSLLVEHDHPARDENVLRATKDAINALIGGLDFDVEDEQVATELVLERQLARNAFDAALKSAERARLLSVSLAEELDRLIKQTRRDLRVVEEEWATAVPDRLEGARQHIRDRLNTERHLLTKVREALTSDDARLLAAAVRIAQLLEECQHRHESLHQRVIAARGVFLEEQERQAFRPPALITMPDPHQQVLLPVLELGRTDVASLTDRFLIDMLGPQVPRLPRLYRLVNDLWSRHTRPDTDDHGLEYPELADPPPPLLRPEIIDVAMRAVRSIGLPARLSTLISACHEDAQAPSGNVREEGAEVLNLAVLWAFSPEEADDDGGMVAEDLMVRILGPRTAVDTDGTPLRLPGWDGDDVIVAPDPDTLATAGPASTTRNSAHIPHPRTGNEPR